MDVNFYNLKFKQNRSSSVNGQKEQNLARPYWLEVTLSVADTGTRVNVPYGQGGMYGGPKLTEVDFTLSTQHYTYETAYSELRGPLSCRVLGQVEKLRTLNTTLNSGI